MRFSAHRRQAARLLLAATALAVIAGPTLASQDDDNEGCSCSLRHGKIFISTNAPTGNEVLVYQRASAGPALPLARFATQGTGTGAGLGSQGALTLSQDGRFLFVVNAGSNTLSTFAFGGSGLVLKSVVDTGGLTPTSVAEHDGLVYVMNSGGSGNVVGFRNQRGTLVAVPGAVGTMSAAGGTAPAQVGFSADGDVLVITERNTNRLTSFLVRRDGTLAGKTVTASSGAVPFGFAFTKRNVLVVSEAPASTVSSYRFQDHSATPRLVTASLPNGQGAACWIAVTPNGRLAFSANAATSSVSSFNVAANGALSLISGPAGSTGVNGGAIDMAVSPDGTQLHVFASRGLQIVSFTIAPGGLLLPLGAAGGMPAGSAGLAAN